MLASLTFFITTVVIGSILAILLYVKSPRKYFKTKEGLGVLRGILIVTTAVIVLAVGSTFFNKAEAFEYGGFKYLDSAEVYLGLEDTVGKVSPMCVPNQDTLDGGNSDRLTSNLGVEADLITTQDGMASVSFKYTHHSCAFNPDNRGYDAAGIVFNYKLW